MLVAQKFQGTKFQLPPHRNVQTWTDRIKQQPANKDLGMGFRIPCLVGSLSRMNNTPAVPSNVLVDPLFGLQLEC
jgi:hypothetical protein